MSLLRAEARARRILVKMEEAWLHARGGSHERRIEKTVSVRRRGGYGLWTRSQDRYACRSTAQAGSSSASGSLQFERGNGHTSGPPIRVTQP